MPKEIERKYLVRDESIIEGKESLEIVQGYLSETGATVRVRVVDGVRGYITVKGRPKGPSKSEWEYEIPVSHAIEMLKSECGDRIIEKTRYLVPVDEVVFEVDVFKGRYAGVIVAEVELKKKSQFVPQPVWLGKEVTGKKGCSNRAMACNSPHARLRLVAA